MDRGTVGVLLIAAVLSTIVVLFLAGEGGSGILIMRNDHPSSLSITGEKYIFSQTFLCRQRFQMIRVEYAYLQYVRELLHLEPGVPDDMIPEIDPVETLADLVHIQGLEPRIWRTSVTWSGKELDLHIFDFSQAPTVKEAWMNTFYAVGFDEDGHALFFKGIHDIVPDRERCLEWVEIGHNDSFTRYQREVPAFADATRPIEECPANATIMFGPVERNDSIRITFSIDSVHLPKHNGVIQLTILDSDGTYLLVANGM